jgi:Rrf2 family transcriptional regulator, nitric oxide-sensitive transcriptional repressor
MKLQIATRLALYAVLQLAADPARQFSAAEIADRFGISVNHLAKVLRTLGRAGLVEALRGAGGGYRFRGNARRVTLLDVIQLFEEVGPSPNGGDEPGAASPEGGALRQVMDEIDDIARATVGSITLATMLKLMEQHRPPAPASTPRGGGERERSGGASAGAQRR